MTGVREIYTVLFALKEKVSMLTLGGYPVFPIMLILMNKYYPINIIWYKMCLREYDRLYLQKIFFTSIINIDKILLYPLQSL